jgi:hypothetical protein
MAGIPRKSVRVPDLENSEVDIDAGQMPVDTRIGLRQCFSPNF